MRLLSIGLTNLKLNFNFYTAAKVLLFLNICKFLYKKNFIYSKLILHIINQADGTAIDRHTTYRIRKSIRRLKRRSVNNLIILHL